MVITGSYGKALEILIILCKPNTFSILEPPVIVPFSFGSSVVNTGVFAQLTCVVSQGDMPISISWSLKGKDLNSGDSITTNMLGQRVSMLVIGSVDYTHIGEYTCRATNTAGSVTHATQLKVNGKQYGHTREGTGTIYSLI